MPIDRRDLLFLSKIPFLLSGEEHLSLSRWCFYLSFNWGIHKDLPPSMAQRILTLAFEEKILEKQNETITLKERIESPPLYKFDKKNDLKELINFKPYPLKNKIEYNEVELQIQEKTKKEKKKEPPAEQLQKPHLLPKEEVKEEKQKEELKVKEEKAKQKTKSTKKQKPKEDKPELTLDHFTKT